jgi:hypothetical protein
MLGRDKDLSEIMGGGAVWVGQKGTLHPTQPFGINQKKQLALWSF